MSLTGEAKREWRRKNREKHKKYNEEWKRNNPERVAASNVRAAQKAKAKPEAIARRMYYARLKSDELFALEVKDRKRQRRLSKRKDSLYAGGWNWKLIGRIVSKINRKTHKDPWDDKCRSLARASRFRVRASRREKAEKREGVYVLFSWESFADYGANRANINAKRRSEIRSNSIEYQWREFCINKAKQINLRSKVDEVIANEK